MMLVARLEIFFLMEVLVAVSKDLKFLANAKMI